MPCKRYEKPTIDFLTRAEIEALIGSADHTTRSGRRDRTLLLLALQTGLRVSELINLNCGDVVLGTGAHVRCMGKGRKERSTPLRKDCTQAQSTWLQERAGAHTEPLFVSNRGTRLSRDAVESIVRKHFELASDTCATLKGKRVSPHVLRHSAAMQQSGSVWAEAKHSCHHRLCESPKSWSRAHIARHSFDQWRRQHKYSPKKQRVSKTRR
jgi:integrase/recombinase XerD